MGSPLHQSVLQTKNEIQEVHEMLKEKLGFSHSLEEFEWAFAAFWSRAMQVSHQDAFLHLKRYDFHAIQLSMVLFRYVSLQKVE